MGCNVETTFTVAIRNEKIYFKRKVDTEHEHSFPMTFPIESMDVMDFAEAMVYPEE